MKIHKTMTDAVLEANRSNAQSSTGPRTEQGKAAASKNALKHGIFAKSIEFRSDHERAEFQRLLIQCRNELNPVGLLEEFLVDDIAIQFWKLQVTNGLEAKELLLRQEQARDPLRSIFQGDLKLPVSYRDLPVERGWDCERIVVRAVAGEDASNSRSSQGPVVCQGVPSNATQKTGHNNTEQEARHLEVEAVLGNALDKIVRYQAAVKRDLYKAIRTLRSLQAERREPEKQRAGS